MKNHFLNLSIIFQILSQLLSNGLCRPELTTNSTVTTIQPTITTTINILDKTDEIIDIFTETTLHDDSNRTSDQIPNNRERLILNSSEEIDDDDPENEETEQLIDRDRNVMMRSDERSSIANSNIDSSNSTADRHNEDEHSEIEDTTATFDNVTLPSLSEMIEFSGQEESDSLNKTQPRRFSIDMSTNDEIYDSDEMDKMDKINNGLDADNFTDYLESPECGRNRFDNEVLLTERIIGGNTAMPGEFPWMVSIRLTHPNLGQIGHWCGGVLIKSNWIATASHCLNNPLFRLPEASYWQVRLGKHNIRQKEPTEKAYRVAKLFPIKHYHAYDNDLALLKLESNVEQDAFIRPICLPLNDRFDFLNSECYAIGWGNDYIKKGSDELQKVKMNIYDNIDCHRVYYPKFRITIKNLHLCAGNKSGGKGTCHSDSGGPIQCLVRNRWYLAGITSFGSNCAKIGFPDVFTKITYHLNWIKETIRSEA